MRLDYFADHAPGDAPRHRRAVFWWSALGLGWLPFACGVVSSRAVVLSGLPDLVRVHVHAGAVFMGTGILLSAACAAAFMRAGDWTAGLIATGSCLLQVGSFLCVSG